MSQDNTYFYGKILQDQRMKMLVFNQIKLKTFEYSRFLLM